MPATVFAAPMTKGEPMPEANLFNPFGSQPQHENRLTWAFLVALKYDPLLQDFLRELVESRLPPNPRESRNAWESARVSTQTSGIDSRTNRLVSVLLTDEASHDVAVSWSGRDAVYDGVIEYPTGLTLIIENKLDHGDVWEGQLSPSRNSFSGNIDDVVLHDSAVCLEWSEVLEGVLKYADSSIASFGSREIARDLLSLVEELHPKLTPYRSFKLCGNRREALRRRMIRLLDSLAHCIGLESRDDWYLFRPGKIAERVGIGIPDVEPVTLRVCLWPASTRGQADKFFESVSREDFLSLNEQGWNVAPNLNFSYNGTKLIWATTAWEASRYLDYFSSGERLYGRKHWCELLPLIEEWEAEGLVSLRDRQQIENVRDRTNREYLDINPEFSVSRKWELDTVIELEERETLETDIIERLATPLATWRERPSPIMSPIM